MLILAILLSFKAWFTIDASAKERVKRWLQFRYDNVLEYVFVVMSLPKADAFDYQLTWIPEGFTLTKETKWDKYYSALYENESKTKGFFFSYDYIEPGDQMFYIGNDIEVRVVSVNGCEANFMPAESEEDSNVLMWQDEDGIVFHVDGLLEYEELVKIAESIQ